MDDAIPQDDLVVIEVEDCDAWQMPEGTLLIGRLDPFVAQGFMDILPGKILPEQSMPVPGAFKQMAGSSVVIVFEGDNEKEKKEVKAGEVFKIPANTEYSIENPTQEKSVVYWRFDGDITEQMEQLKSTLPKIPFQARDASGYVELFEEYQRRNEEKQGDR